MAVVNIEAWCVCDHGTYVFGAPWPPLWHSAQVLAPRYVPAVMVCVMLVLPVAVLIVATTVYWPATSGRSSLRPATCTLARSAILYVGTFAPRGLASSVAFEPTGVPVSSQVTPTRFVGSIALFTRASR